MIVAIDSHMHGDILIKRDRDFPQKYYSNNIGGIVWAYNDKIKDISQYAQYWDYLAKITRNISKVNSPFFYKVGIHPRTICRELKDKQNLPTEIKKALENSMKDPKCLGIGEIGLDGYDQDQEKIFIEQLDWCINYLPENKRIGIHTPRNNKYEITKKTLEILSNYNALHKQIVIDHVELSTIELLKNIHVHIGITLQQGKSSKEDVESIVNMNLYDINKILLNSDGGQKISKEYIQFVKENGLKPRQKSQLLKDNVISFYNLNKQLN